ncbi:oxygen-independent coproporphyrinogen III oxidase [Sphingorhabdus sp. IMCC26285]|uniref:Coproporphyrinogen-III oxidase n=2 Tax=Sphingorhabdus profundilacus TaxID=2509718 RepID=A0A6I4M2F8_9SPHN|nr:oxygen-independent coproporphyrinogen III oxidase [Sphingorhabdus profundilacus]MVZ98230.1 oxygen-independent coproporphyrinogen III oxidase [Sphingorhabdus profundilacus]
MWPYYPELLSRPVPRYTSYPTAAEFHGGVGAKAYVQALDAIAPGTPLSLYVHIPFCKMICWYCGCNTGAASKAQRLAAYLDALETELTLVAKRIGGRGSVKRIAFGGGSPNALSTVEFVRLLDRIITVFAAGQPEISIEIDPRGFTSEWALVLAASNVSRVSLGVQTFAPHVQEAIGRIQPLSLIENCVSALRMRGIDAINFDLMYGLPNQSLADLGDSIEQAIRLRPTRVALFGYAHLPNMIPRQRRIDGSILPDANLRFQQSALGYDLLTSAGYMPIGFDHFALPEDPLAIAAKSGKVRRNFQGFTEDCNDNLLGFGASSISMLPGLLVQNEKNVGPYRDHLNAGTLPTVRGFIPDANDIEHSRWIERLLCEGSVELGSDAETRRALQPFEDRGLTKWRGNILYIEDSGRPYARCIAATFDRFRTPDKGQASQAI